MSKKKRKRRKKFKECINLSMELLVDIPNNLKSLAEEKYTNKEYDGNLFPTGIDKD